MTPFLFCKHRSILRRLLMLKAACGGKIVEHTVSGAIVTFITNLVAPLKQLVAQINSAQDLHGYSYPWPAGGGKNLFDPSSLSHTTYTVNSDGSITVSSGDGRAWSNIPEYPLKAGTYTISATGFANNSQCQFRTSEDSYYTTQYLRNTVENSTFTLTSDGGIKLKVGTGTSNYPVVFKVQIESGSTATSYTPYSNICPIGGYNNVTVKKAQRNIWAFDASYNPAGYAVLVPRNTEFYLPAGTYTFSAVPNIESSSVVLGGYYADDTQITLARLNASEERQSATFTIAKPLSKMYLIANKGGTISDIQLEVGSTASSYEPYSGNTYSITFPAAAGTVYGGTVDVTTGVLTVNKVSLTFNGSEDWASVTANGHTRQRVNSVLIGIKQITGGGQTPNLISDIYPTKTPNATYAGTVGITNQQNSADLYIMDNRYDYVDSASDYKTWLSTNNLKVVYELAEPVTYQLTPTEVTTLLGDNTIWASTGDVSVTYYAKE